MMKRLLYPFQQSVDAGLAQISIFSEVNLTSEIPFDYLCYALSATAEPLSSHSIAKSGYADVDHRICASISANSQHIMRKSVIRYSNSHS